MSTSTTTIRRVAWLLAALLVAATVLALVLAFDLTGAPPKVDESADLPTRILAFQSFDQSRWPIDLLSTLLYAAAFGVVVVLGALLFGRTGRAAMLGLLVAAGILGVGSELVHAGAHEVATRIGYCDCGFKTQEAISQAWGLMLIDGIADWLLNGTAILLAVGVVLAGRALAGRGMPAAWSTFAWVVAIGLVAGVVLSVLGVDSPIVPLLVAVVGGVLVPIWAGWLGARLAEDGRPVLGEPASVGG